MVVQAAKVTLNEEERDVLAGFFYTDWPMHLLTFGDVVNEFAGEEAERREKARVFCEKLGVLGELLDRGKY